MTCHVANVRGTQFHREKIVSLKLVFLWFHITQSWNNVYLGTPFSHFDAYANPTRQITLMGSRSIYFLQRFINGFSHFSPSYYSLFSSSTLPSPLPLPPPFLPGSRPLPPPPPPHTHRTVLQHAVASRPRSYDGTNFIVVQMTACILELGPTVIYSIWLYIKLLIGIGSTIFTNHRTLSSIFKLVLRNTLISLYVNVK